MDNSLWNLYDEIILVCKKTDKNNYYKAYVVNPNNKTQLETARRWAIGYNKKENKNTVFLQKIFSCYYIKTNTLH